MARDDFDLDKITKSFILNESFRDSPSLLSLVRSVLSSLESINVSTNRDKHNLEVIKFELKQALKLIKKQNKEMLQMKEEGDSE
jgi:hypothetical protein